MTDILTANPGYNVVLGRHHYFKKRIYLWFELEPVVAWKPTEDGRDLLPITVKHGLIRKEAKHFRRYGIQQPDGSIVNIYGTFSSLEEMRMRLWEFEVTNELGMASV